MTELPAPAPERALQLASHYFCDFMQKRQDVLLVLEDGRYFEGSLLGQLQPEGRIGEIVFNTSMSGYQEIITDPSYKKQIVCFTYPSIGNYGINDEDFESDLLALEGIIVRDYCEVPSNFRSRKTLDSFLEENRLPGITGIDTRALVRHIREKGAMMGGIFPADPATPLAEQVARLQKKVQSAPSMEGLNLTDEFDGQSANAFVQRYIDRHQLQTQNWPKVAVLDFGIKFSILENLLEQKLLPVAFAGNTPWQQWKNFEPASFQGIFLSNGPGDPAAVEHGIDNIRHLLSLNLSVFGICLGHQMLSLALGAQTYKLKFGHHGGNQPVKSSAEATVTITAQNHGFAVDAASLDQALLQVEKSSEKRQSFEVLKNLNDQTVEGYYFVAGPKKLLSVQHHPEAAPGPHDARQLFTRFRQMIG